MKNQKGFAHLFILIIILMVGIGTWWLYSKNKLPTSQTSERYYVADIDQCSLIEYDCPEGYQGFNDDKGCGCELIPLKTDDINISNWATYKDNELGIIFKHPQDWPNPNSSSDKTGNHTTYYIEINTDNSFKVSRFKLDKPFEELRTIMESPGIQPIDPKLSDYNLGGIDGFIGEASTHISFREYLVYIPFPNSNENEVIQIYFKHLQEDFESKELFYQVLTTFEFID